LRQGHNANFIGNEAMHALNGWFLRRRIVSWELQSRAQRIETEIHCAVENF